MKNTILKAMSLSILLTSPLALGLPALAEPPAPRAEVRAALADNVFQVAQHSQQEEYDAFFQSQYDYWDAKLLAKFWGQDLAETKARMGRKILWGGENKAMLGMFLADARVKALGSVENLEFYSESGYSYNDAEALARYWGDADAWQGKLRIERNLILGNDDWLSTMMEAVRR